MEQNQQTNTLSSTQQQWKQLRQQYADTEESIKDEHAVELMEQWINLKYNNQFHQYEQNENNPQGNKSLKEIIRQVITNQNQTNWIIKQKYNLEHAQHLITKAKQIYQQFKNQNRVSDIKQKSIRNASVKSKSRNGSSVISHRSTQKKSNNQIILPLIKLKGKIYNPLQLSSDFQLLQDTTKEYKPRSPHIFEGQQQINKQSASNIFKNRFLKMAFQKFCKRSYNYNGTFSQISNQDKLNLNKWMVFCKQFDFTEKFHIKDLISIFQTATNFISSMDLDQFLHAVALLQQKYLDRFHTGEKFVQDVLKINSQAAFRIKMQNLKVSYAGPRNNFFEAGTYPQHLRLEEVQKQKQFQLKKRKKQMVLIQGMYEQHLKDQINKRKQQREQKKKGQSNLMNQSLIMQKQPVKQILQQQRYVSKSPQKLNYSKIFYRNKNNTQQKTTKPIQVLRLNNSSLHKTQGSKKYQKKQDQKQINRNVVVNSNKDLSNANDKSNPEDNLKNSKAGPRRQWAQDKSSLWITKIRSDSQESDEILKQHLQLQKRIKEGHQSLKVKNLMKQMQAQSARVDAIKERIKQQEMNETRHGLYQKIVE